METITKNANLSPEILPEDRNTQPARTAAPAPASAPSQQVTPATTPATSPAPAAAPAKAQTPVKPSPAPSAPVGNASNETACRGYVVRCDGEYAVINARVPKDGGQEQNSWSVGQLVSIFVGSSRVIGLTCRVTAPKGQWISDDENLVEVTLELVGEIVNSGDGNSKFSSGIASYPQMGCTAAKISTADLSVIYRSEGDSVVRIGNLTQDANVDAKIDIDKLLSRHFAIVGTTGVGKSTSVTLMLRKIVEARPDIRVLMLDPHNEFATAFPKQSVVIDSSNLILPFWLFKLDEFSEVVFRGQSGFDAELEILRDLIPQAKEMFRSDVSGKSTLTARKAIRTNMTADMPVPYRLVDLLKLIDDRLGLLDGKAEKPLLKALQYRLDSISKDPRFRFMFDQGSGGDIMEQILAKIFRVPQDGKPISVLEMSGLPTEVVNSVVSVLCRMSFDLAMNSNGGIQTLVVCEEAHRYIPADENAGFWPTRQSIARIAKEGRKYGVFLSIITQRPGELDPTILSQCNTLFAMRLGNERDQEIIRGAVTNGAKSTISFLSSIANRECIAFGEAIHTPMRMTFETMRAEDLPGAQIYEQQRKIKEGMGVSLSSVLRRMRMDDRGASNEESLVDAEEQLLRADMKRDNVTPDPGDEINSILNAAYSDVNNSLTAGNGGRAATPAQKPSRSGGFATGQLNSQPQAGTSPSSPAEARPARDSGEIDGVGGFFNSLRRK